jgi:hypothetical protein
MMNIKKLYSESLSKTIAMSQQIDGFTFYRINSMIIQDKGANLVHQLMDNPRKALKIKNTFSNNYFLKK